MRNISILILVLLAVLGCSKDEVEDDLEATELAYYTSAQDSLRAGNYAGGDSKATTTGIAIPIWPLCRAGSIGNYLRLL